MKKINLFIIFAISLILLTSINVQADTMGFNLKCNGEEDVYQTFTGDILKCDISSTGTGIYNFKTVIILYDLGPNVSFEKFVPNKDWDDTIEKEGEGIILSSKEGIPLNRSFGTLYVKVKSTQFGSNSFNVIINDNENGETKILYTINIHESNENRLNSVKINDGNLKINIHLLM